jgi:hypothetical protein
VRKAFSCSCKSPWKGSCSKCDDKFKDIFGVRP